MNSAETGAAQPACDTCDAEVESGDDSLCRHFKIRKLVRESARCPGGLEQVVKETVY